MPSKIVDEFSDLPITRQEKYMLRKRKIGLCARCGKKAVSDWYCEKHLLEKRIQDSLVQKISEKTESSENNKFVYTPKKYLRSPGY